MYTYIVQSVKVRQSLHVCLVFNQLLSSSVQETNVRISLGHSLTIQLQHQSQHTMSSRVLGPEVELHVPHEPLRLRNSTSVRHQLRIVFLWRNVEIILSGLQGHGRVVMSLQDGLRDVGILPPGGGGVHDGLALVQSHVLLVRIPVVFTS